MPVLSVAQLCFWLLCIIWPLSWLLSNIWSCVIREIFLQVIQWSFPCVSSAEDSPWHPSVQGANARRSPVRGLCKGKAKASRRRACGTPPTLAAKERADVCSPAARGQQGGSEHGTAERRGFCSPAPSRCDWQQSLSSSALSLGLCNGKCISFKETRSGIMNGCWERWTFFAVRYSSGVHMHGAFCHLGV